MPHYRFHLQASTGEQTGTIFGNDEADARARLEAMHPADASTENFRTSNRGRVIKHRILKIELEEIKNEQASGSPETNA